VRPFEAWAKLIMSINLYPINFRQFYPLIRLNKSLDKLDIFNGAPSKPLEMSYRLRRYVACTESLRRNTIRFRHLLNSISKHFNISYESKRRKEPRKFQYIKNEFSLMNDLLLFVTVLKIFLDGMAFLVPFYYREALRYNKNIPDLRDAERPPSFNGLKHFFFNNEDIDVDFVSILRANEEWTNEVCNMRNFLIHRFHDLSVNNDWWTQSYYGLLYEFNDIKEFIPDTLLYVAKIYYKFVKFTKDFEEHFKNRCRDQFPEFEYFDSGHASGNCLDKRHLFFAGLGRLLENKILIRIQAKKLRSRIPKILEYFMREENIVCTSCDKFIVHINSTIEHYVVISANCDCGKLLPIPLSIEKKFYPHFMNPNKGEIGDRLVPNELKIKMLRL